MRCTVALRCGVRVARGAFFAVRRGVRPNGACFVLTRRRGVGTLGCVLCALCATRVAGDSGAVALAPPLDGPTRRTLKLGCGAPSLLDESASRPLPVSSLALPLLPLLPLLPVSPLCPPWPLPDEPSSDDALL